MNENKSPHWRQALSARFDTTTLRAPPWDTPAPAVSAQAVALLRAWCFDGMGSGAAPLFVPSARPDLPLPCKIALVRSASAADVVLALGLELDGSLRLQARPGRIATTLLRLRVKLCDAVWWRARRADDVWDFGFLADTTALATFTPRRATLVVVDRAGDGDLRAAVDGLLARGAALRRPVRLLLTAGQFDGVEVIDLP